MLGTVELLELILSHLPCVAVFDAQKVSKTWREVVAANSFLQKGCFLKALSDPLDTTGVWLAASKRYPHPAEAAAKLWRQNRHADSTPLVLDVPAWDVTPSIVLQNSSTANTNLLNPFARLLLRLCDTQYRKQYQAMAQTLGKKFLDSRLMDMFLTQPPSAKIVVRQAERNSDREYHIRRLSTDFTIKKPSGDTIEKPSGVTIRDLAMRIEQNRQNDHASEWWYPVYAGILESGDDEADKADEKRGHIELSRKSY